MGRFNVWSFSNGYLFSAVFIPESEIKSKSDILNYPFLSKVFFIKKNPAFMMNLGISD
jgi:hypothetical protein